MSQYQRVFRILGPFIGFALLYFVITNGMDFLQRGQLEAVAEQTAAETMTGTEGITTTEVAVVTGTTGTADTGTATAAVTETATAATQAVTETAAAVTTEATAAVTETAAAVTQAVTETAAAPTTAVTETAAAATQAVTETAAAATTAVTETAAAATSAVTTTQAATVTAPAPDATTPVTASVAPTTAAAASAATEAAAPVADTSAFLKPDGTASDAVVAAITKGGCTACHTIAGVPNAMGQVGPNLNNIGADAATREPGVNADQYIHESLMDPNKFIAPECPFGACVPGTMPQNVAQLMTPDEVELVVQFLLTRKADS